MLQAGDPPPDEAPEDADRLGARGADRLGRARGADGEADGVERPGHVGGVDRAAGGDERAAAFEEAVAEIAARVGPAYSRADGWLGRTRAALVELLRFCDERPDTARGLVVESIVWGAEVLERRGQLLDALAGALDRGCEEIDPARVPPPETAENLVGACVSLVHTRLLRGEPGSFVELAPSLMSMIVHPYLGAAAARRELERSLTELGAEAAERESEPAFTELRQAAR
jgi:hypothetical protein